MFCSTKSANRRHSLRPTSPRSRLRPRIAEIWISWFPPIRPSAINHYGTIWGLIEAPAANQLDAGSWPGTASHLSLNLHATQSDPDTNFNNGGVLALRDPLSTDLVNLGRIHTRLHYFNASNGYDTQQAGGIKLTIQY